ncbi:MAG: FIST C-terminal domain-containing protein [Rhodocyclaceae bacterium]
MPTKPPAATALASADKPSPEVVADTVEEAMARAGVSIAQSVLLFLSADFVRIAPQAVHAASRAAQCLQVAGCTAHGVFTETDWVMDRPAVGVMVFGDGISLGGDRKDNAPRLSLALPRTVAKAWLDDPIPHCGLISTGIVGQDEGRIWGNGKVLAEQRFDASFHGVRGACGVSTGFRALGSAMEITAADGYELQRLDGAPALATLLRELPLELREEPRLPHHLLAAAVLSGDEETAIEQGRFTPVPIIAANLEEQSVTLAAQLAPATRICWCVRQPLAAECHTRHALLDAEARLGTTPDFALMFSCIGRGPYFFGGRDRDLELIREGFPGLPIIGAYGSGQIAPLPPANHLIHNSAVIALFAADVQS